MIIGSGSAGTTAPLPKGGRGASREPSQGLWVPSQRGYEQPPCQGQLSGRLGRSHPRGIWVPTQLNRVTDSPRAKGDCPGL